MTTTELGINVATGQSEENLDKLAKGMEGVLDKYLELMKVAGRSDEAFAKISKTLGIHSAAIKEMSMETVKAMAVMAPEIKKAQDMSIRGLSTNITKQFGKISTELKVVFAQLPAELTRSMQAAGVGMSGVTTELTKGMTQIGAGLGYINNSIGGLRTELFDLMEVIEKVGLSTKKMHKDVGSNTPEVSGDTNSKKSYAAFLRDATEMDAAVKQANSRKYSRFLQDAAEMDEAIKAETELRTKLQEDAARKKIESLRKGQQEEIAARKEATRKIVTEIQRGMEEERGALREKFDQAAGVTPRTEEDTLRAIEGIKKRAKEAHDLLQAASSSKGFLDQKDLQQYQIILTHVNKETKELSRANVDMAGQAGMAMKELSTVVGKLNEDFKRTKVESKTSFMDAMGIKLPELKEVQDRIRSVAGELNSLDIQALPLGDLIKYRNVLEEIAKDATKIKASQEKGAVSVMASDIKDLIKKKELEREIVAQLEEQAAVSKKQSDIEGNKARAVQLLREKLVTLQGTLTDTSAKMDAIRSGVNTRQFVDLSDLKQFYVTMTESIKTLQQLKTSVKNTGDDTLFTQWEATLQGLITESQQFNRAIKGMAPTKVGALENEESTQLQEQITLLRQIEDAVNKVKIAKDRLHTSKGDAASINSAKADLSALEEEKKRLSAIFSLFSKEMSNMGIHGSQAVQDIKAAMGTLGTSMGTFKSQISATETSFKGLWGTMTIGFGKFLLYRHTAGIIFSDIQNVVQNIGGFLRTMGTEGSKIINLEKTLLAIRGNTPDSIRDVREDKERLNQIAEYYGYSIDQISKFYVKITAMGKELDWSKKGIVSFFEEVVAGAKGLGLSSQEFEELSKGLEQLMNKGAVYMEDLTQQLSEKIPAVLTHVQQYMASIKDAETGTKRYQKLLDDKGTLNIKENVKKLNEQFSDTAYEDYVMGVRKALASFAKVADATRGDFESNMQRMSKAWTDLQANFLAGEAGKALIGAVTRITDMLKDPQVSSGLATMVTALAKIVEMLAKVANSVLPSIVDKVGAAVKASTGIDVYKGIANSNAPLKQAYLKSQFHLSGGLYNDSYSSNYYASNSTGYAKFQEDNVKEAQFKDYYSSYKNSFNDEIAKLEMYNIVDIVAKGYIQFGEDSISQAKNATEALANSKQFNKENAEEVAAAVTTPLLNYIKNTGKSIDAIIKEQIIPAANQMMLDTGEYSKLLVERQATGMGEPTKTPLVIGGSEIAKKANDGTLSVIGLNGSGGKGAKGPTAEQTAAVEAEIERLRGEVAGLAAEGSYAKQKALAYMRKDVGDIRDEVKKGATPEQKAILDSLRQQKADLEASAIDKQAQQEVDAIQAEIAGKILSGRLKNQLKTQYDDIIKWQMAATQKIEDKLLGMGFDTEGMKAKIQEAVEVMSQEALMQGNTPMEVIEKAERRAASGMLNAWKVTYSELTQLMAQYNALQIEAQFNLMQVEDNISGKRIQKEKERIAEAASENKKNFKNSSLQDDIAKISVLSKDMELLQTRKDFFGSLFDASGMEEASLSLNKITVQLQALEKQYGLSVPVMKEFDRQQQAITDTLLDKSIQNAGSFTQYLSLRFAKETGVTDNVTVRMQKQFETMYDRIGNGATEVGDQIEKAFTDSFTGTLDSWTDVWKQIKAIAIKTIAEIVWAAKANPIKIGLASWLTGVTPAGATTPKAGSGTNGLIDKASEVTTPMWGENVAGGVFGKISSGIEDMTDSLNEWGKETLGLHTDLVDALMGAGLGYGIGTMMFPDNQVAKLGGAIGGALGQVAGATIGEAMGFSAGGPIGSAIGSVIGSTIGKFIGQEKKLSDYGVRITVDSDGIQFLDKYEKVKKSGGLGFNLTNGLSSFVSSGMFGPVGWLHGSSRESYSSVDPAVYKQISSTIEKSFSTVSRQMLALGMSPDFSGFSVTEKVSLKGKDPDALLKAWLDKLAGKITDTALVNNDIKTQFEAVKKSGETSAETLERLVDAMAALQEGAASANVSIEALAGGLSGLDLAAYASDLSEALGGSSGVSAFFDRIEKFIGYTGTVGIANMSMFSNKLETALGNINSYADNSGTRTSVLSGEMGNLQTTKDYLTSKLTAFTKGNWGKWFKFDGENLSFTGRGSYGTMDDIATSTRWGSSVKPYIDMYKELLSVNKSIQATQTKLDRESSLPVSAGINASSATFWGDYQKALSQPGGLTPELAAAWDAAAALAQSMSEMRDSATEARKSLEEIAVSYNEQRRTLQQSATVLGTTSTALWDLSLKAQALNQSDLATWFDVVGNNIAEGLIPGLSDFIRTGETALDTIVRLTTAFTETDKAAQLAGTSVQALSGGKTGLAAANYAQGLIDYFGSQENVSAMFSSITEAIYTDTEASQIAEAYWKKQVMAQASALDAGDSVDAIKKWIKERITAGDLSGEQLASIGQLSTSINNLESASDSAKDSVESLADYMQDLADKIAKIGMTDTESFIFDLNQEVTDIKKKITELGGGDSDLAVADQYRVAMIADKLATNMDEVYKSIRKLTTNDLLEQINQLSDSYWEQISSAKLLGATQEELNAILYNSYLQAQQVLSSAANAYIQAYDNTVSKIEELQGKQKALEDDVDQARSDYMDSLQKEIDLKQEAIDKLQENVDALKDFITNLSELKNDLAVSAGFLSPTEKANVTMSQFSQTAIAAAGGDETARGNVASQAKSALDAASSGSYSDYIASFAKIYGTANSLQASAQSQLDPAEAQLKELIASRDKLQAIYDVLKEEADKTKSIDDARTAYETAQTALANSTYNAQIQILQASVDQHKDTVEALRKQYDTTVDLATAASTYFEIKGIIEKAVPDVSVLTAGMAPVPATMDKQVAVSEAIQGLQTQIASDTKNSSKYTEKIFLVVNEMLEYLEPVDTADKTDKGIKTIVAAASLREGVLQALRASNDLTSVDATSVIGLLNGIKTCTCSGL